MRILVDTIVLLCRVRPASPHHQVAVDVLAELRSARHELCIVPQIIYEFWSAELRPLAMNKLGMSVYQATQSIQALLQEFLLLKEGRGIAAWHSQIAIHSVGGESSQNARLVATMQRHGLSHLLTFNVKDFEHYPGLVLLSPIDIMAGNLPVAAV